MKNFKAEIENLTKQEVYDLLDAKVVAINESNDPEEKAKLAEQCKVLCTKYNELSMLTVYGACAKAEKPVLEFAQTYYYPTVSTKDELAEDLTDDGRKIIKSVRTINEGEKRLDLFDFLKWAEKTNRTVTAEKHWKGACEETRNSIESEWKKIFSSGAENNKISFGKIKTNLQKMYDALLFIPSENGNNRVMATGAVARYLFGFANVRKDSRTKDGEIKITKSILSTRQWVTLVMDALHETVKDKDYAPNTLEFEYGSDEKSKDDAPAQPKQAETVVVSRAK